MQPEGAPAFSRSPSDRAHSRTAPPAQRRRHIHPKRFRIGARTGAARSKGAIVVCFPSLLRCQRVCRGCTWTGGRILPRSLDDLSRQICEGVQRRQLARGEEAAIREASAGVSPQALACRAPTLAARCRRWFRDPASAAGRRARVPPWRPSPSIVHLCVPHVPRPGCRRRRLAFLT